MKFYIKKRSIFWLLTWSHNDGIYPDSRIGSNGIYFDTFKQCVDFINKQIEWLKTNNYWIV